MTILEYPKEFARIITNSFNISTDNDLINKSIAAIECTKFSLQQELELINSFIKLCMVHDNISLAVDLELFKGTMEKNLKELDLELNYIKNSSKAYNESINLNKTDEA